jgi:hypothetical protein
LFAGVGIRGKSWWLENMLQRQFSPSGNSWILDERFQKQFGKRYSLFAEASPFLTKKAFYDFVSAEYSFVKLGLGAETENVHKSGKDSLGAGPRLSYALLSAKQVKIVSAASYQFRRDEPKVLRFYVVCFFRAGSKN